MARRLDARRPDFPDAFAALLGAKRESAPAVDEAVAAIIADVRARGDAALLELTRRFDGHDVGPGGLRVTEAESDAGSIPQTFST